MDSPVQQIKEKLDIVEFIRNYVPLQPAGKNFKAPCPFHKEKTPSFMVSPDRQTWHCFGQCAEGGDIFKFLMKYENIEFYEALKILAEKAGIELKRLSPQDQRQFGVLYDINSIARDFYKEQLTAAPEVLKYLSERGLKKETIDEFELGFAPQGFDKLILSLVKTGFDIKDVERAGLAFKTERGSYMDRFRGRLMFPIYDNFGKVVAFSGRILPQYERGGEGNPSAGSGQAPSASSGLAAAKYINSPETPVFNKSRVLYGFHKTKNNIKDFNAAVLVEGQMDFLMLFQDGVKNVVATSGTALTPDHLKTIRRFADTLILSFDNDEAGIKAAERSIDLAGANDFNVKLLALKDYKDPAEAVQKKPGHMADLIKSAISSMEFYFSRYLGEGRKEMRDLKKNLRVILGKIKNLSSPIEKSQYLKELADRTGVSENALMEEMAQLKNQLQASQFVNPLTAKNNLKEENILSRRELLAERILSLLIVRENLKNQLDEVKEYFPIDYALIYQAFDQGQKIVDERLLALQNIINLRSTFESEVLGEEKIEEEFLELKKQIHLEFMREKQQALFKLIKELEKKGDEEGVKNLLGEFQEISKIISG